MKITIELEKHVAELSDEDEKKITDFVKNALHPYRSTPYETKLENANRSFTSLYNKMYPNNNDGVLLDDVEVLKREVNRDFFNYRRLKLTFHNKFCPWKSNFVVDVDNKIRCTNVHLGTCPGLESLDSYEGYVKINKKIAKMLENLEKIDGEYIKLYYYLKEF